ncbi:MAG: hypothetical protein U0V49_00370 [Saprospiraceae bacterium]
MHKIPVPILGDVTALTMTSSDLQKSFEYYTHLGFSEVMRIDFPFPWIQITDGALLIMLRQDPNPYIALTYYIKDIEHTEKIIDDAGLVFAEKPKSSDIIQKYLLQSPDQTNISLVHIPEGFTQPKGPTMLRMQASDYSNPEKYVNKTCGMFGELAIPVKDLEISTTFWFKLGFQTMFTSGGPYPWSILSDGLAVIGLHQTNHFSKPTITFFASDMKDKIAQLPSSVRDHSRAQNSGNITLTTPEQQEINLFTLGM